MKAKISAIVDGIEFQGPELQAHLDLETGEVLLISEEELSAAEDGEEDTTMPEWRKEAIECAKFFLENEERYIELPSKYDFHEYRVMEKFVYAISVDEQREEMLRLITGKGAFSRFRVGLDRFLLVEKWHEYRNSALAAFAKSWCEENNIEYENS